ncbi:MAG: RidA family protein [Myxococcales bacterium]|nr:RidA family protein [Myxococcales bacterium]
MSKLEAINPESWGEPKGYANGVLAPAGGRLLFVAGQIGWDENQKIVSDDFALQFAQALSNVVTVVRAAGGQPEHIARLTIYVTDKQLYLADLKGIGASYRELMGRHYPAMALLEIKGLLEPGAMVEIEATAVVP